MLLRDYPLQLEPLAQLKTSGLVGTRRLWGFCYSYHLGTCVYDLHVTLHTSAAGKVTNTSQLYIWREGAENVSEQFLGKFKFSSLSSASSGILENTFFMYVFFIKCSCQKKGRLMFLKRCSEEKTNDWNKTLTEMCLLCLGKNHRFCSAFTATFKLAGSGTSSCLAVGFQWMLYKPNQLPRKVSPCCTSHPSPSPDRLERHQLCTNCTFPVLHRHSWRETIFN